MPPVCAGGFTRAASVGGAPQGAPLILDVNVAGGSVFADQATRPAISPGGFVVRKQVDAEVPSLAAITVDVDQVGSDPDAPGSDLVVSVFAEPVAP